MDILIGAVNCVREVGVSFGSIEWHERRSAMEVKLFVDSLKFNHEDKSPNVDLTTKQRPPKRTFSAPVGVIEEEPDSLETVISNPSLLPLTIVPTHASGLSRLSRCGSHK